MFVFTFYKSIYFKKRLIKHFLILTSMDFEKNLCRSLINKKGQISIFFWNLESHK